MAVKVFQYPKCSTCRKALEWLAAHDVEVESVDIVEHPPAVATLKKVAKLSGRPAAKMLNTSGQSYRNGGWKDRIGKLSDAEIFAALAEDGKLVKRPLVLGKDFALVGFDEDAYAAALG